MRGTAARALSTIGLLVIMAGAGTPAVSADAGFPHVVHITAKRFEYTPRHITLKKNVPVVLELESLDRLHGFNAPGLGIRADIPPGHVARIALTPAKTGVFPFHCDIFCGSGHEGMTGRITVVE